MKTSKQNFFNAIMVANKLKVEKDKLGVNATIFFESNEEIFKKVQREIKKVQVKYCLTDKNEAIIYDEKGNFMFSKENIFDLEDEMEALLSEEITIEPCVTLPEDCERVVETGLANMKNFCGILIP